MLMQPKLSIHTVVLTSLLDRHSLAGIGWQHKKTVIATAVRREQSRTAISRKEAVTFVYLLILLLDRHPTTGLPRRVAPRSDVLRDDNVKSLPCASLQEDRRSTKQFSIPLSCLCETARHPTFLIMSSLRTLQAWSNPVYPLKHPLISSIPLHFKHGWSWSQL